jgi:hypothetical protein
MQLFAKKVGSEIKILAAGAQADADNLFNGGLTKG